MNASAFRAACVAVALLLPSARPWAQDDSADLPEQITISFSKSDIQLNPFHAFSSTEAQLFTAIYEGLVSYDPFTLEPVPAVAKSWTVSKDGKVYTFTLRDDARYWNGEPVTAEDFRNSWLHLLDPQEKAEYSFLLDIVKGAKDYRLGKNTDPKSVGITAVSPTVLRVTLNEPAAHFLKILCHYSFVPFPKAFLSKNDWNTGTTVPGDGPFYILKHSDSEIDLTKNNLYWDADNVSLSSIKILLSDDADRVTDAFNHEDIQWAAGNADWAKVTRTKSIVVNPLFATSYFFFKSSAPPWNNADVRRGLALLLPWDKIRVESDLYIPASTLVPKIASYPDVKGIDRSNYAEAMELLAKAGFTGGKGLPIPTIIIPQGEDMKRIADLMAGAWKSALGLAVEVKTFPYDDYYAAVQKPGYTLATTTWIGDFADPLTFLEMWTSDSNLNDAGYKNPAFDEKIRESMGESEPERYNTLAAAETILLNGAAVLPIDHTPAINLVDLSTIDGWYPNPLDIHPFKYMRVKALEPIPGVAYSS